MTDLHLLSLYKHFGTEHLKFTKNSVNFYCAENDITCTEFNYANLSLGSTGMKVCEVSNSKFSITSSFLHSDHHNALEELILNTVSLFQISVGFVGKDGRV